MFSRFIKQLFAICLLAAATTTAVSASTLIYWTSDSRSGQRYTGALEACKASHSYPASYLQGASPYTIMNCYGTNRVGDAGPYITVVRQVTQNCQYGHTGTACNTQLPSCPHGPFDPVANTCPAHPSENCPAGSFWDFDSNSCKYPQDDACGSIGASWDPAASACQCDSPTDALVTAAGVSRCMALRDDSCTKDSPDFKGYASSGDSAGQAICDGRASCPDGGIPGYVGSGDTMSAICYTPPTEPNDNCDGQSGVMDGVEICVPNPGEDPDFPDCSGVVGTINGVKKCIHKPTEHPDCKPGETAGYVGRGDNAEFTCVPSTYKPQTCPPGQYVINTATAGFGCATANGQSGEDKDAGKTPGKTTGTGNTTVKDAEGNVTGTEETELELDFSQLLQDAPSTDFKGELDKFSESQLDTLDTDSVIADFSGADGAFTERSSLTQLSGFVKTHTIGNTTNCTGTLPFFGYIISCDKFATYNRIVGWMIFIYTLISIYNTIMRKSESGV